MSCDDHADTAPALTEEQVDDAVLTMFRAWQSGLQRRRLPEPLAEDPLDDPDDPDDEWRDAREEVRDRIDFMSGYLGYLLLPGLDPVYRIRKVARFLHLQTGCSDDATYEIRFYRPRTVDCGLPVWVETLSDIDFADTLGMLLFLEIMVKRLDGKRWTKRSAKAFVKEVLDDLHFDMIEPDIDWRIERDGTTLEIYGDWNY